MVRSDDDVIREKLKLFDRWRTTGSSVFTLDDYAVLFQAGVFETGKRCEQFCEAVYRLGPVPGPRKENLNG